MATETHYPDLKESSGVPPASQAASSPRGSEEEISLLDLLIVLAERKWTIALVTLTCAILALIVSFLLPKRYTATVILLPPQQSSSLGAALSSQLSNSLGSMAALAGGSLGIKNPNDMYVAMLTGQTVEDRHGARLRVCSGSTTSDTSPTRARLSRSTPPWTAAAKTV